LEEQDPVNVEGDKGDSMFLSKRKVIVAVVIAALLGMSSLVVGQQGASTPVEFTFRSIDGQTVTSQSLRGEVVVLAFGASWLPLSRTQLQGVRKFADEYGGRGVAVFWVSTESENQKSKNYASDDQLRTFSEKYALKVTVLRDPDGVASKKFGIDKLPSIIIIDKQGNAVGEPIKGLDPDGNLAGQLAARLDKIL
jgi:peroxiredoxin